jgi:hypothetical protein
MFYLSDSGTPLELFHGVIKYHFLSGTGTSDCCGPVLSRLWIRNRDEWNSSTVQGQRVAYPVHYTYSTGKLAVKFSKNTGIMFFF